MEPVCSRSSCPCHSVCGILTAGAAGFPGHGLDGLGRPVRVEHWTNAAEMVRAAADNLSGGPESVIAFTPVPTFWSNQHEVKIKAAGFPALAHQYVVVDKDEEAARLVVEGYAGGELVAVITFNAARAFLAYRKCLAPAAPPDTAASAVPVGS